MQLINEARALDSNAFLRFGWRVLCYIDIELQLRVQCSKEREIRGSVLYGALARGFVCFKEL